MTSVEHCGRPFNHEAHIWQEGPASDIEYHACPGGSVTEEEEDADDRRVELFEQGAYEPEPSRWRTT